MFEHIKNVEVYGMEESVMASGYSMTSGANAPLMTQWAARVPDWHRAERLGAVLSGTGHDCFLKGVVVQFDWRITQVIFPQVERYHFIDIISSQSKMHMLHMAKWEDFHTSVDTVILRRFIALLADYNTNEYSTPDDKREAFERLVYSCPMGYYLTARFTTNYLQLKTIYQQRKGHKLQEWREFCQWVEGLPQFKRLALGVTE